MIFKMMSFENALKKVLYNSRVLSSETVLTEDSAGRVLREDIYSEIKMPPFDKAAMDGFAVNVLDVKIIPVRLKCARLIQAGESLDKKIKRGECVKIMTGAPMPEDTDAVVKLEDTCLPAKGVVEILKPVKNGENVCFQGEDIVPGQKILGKGGEIFSSDIAVLATVGRKFIKVNSKPSVAILNTGGEIIPVGGKLGKNKIYNCNGPLLANLVKSDGIEPGPRRSSRDEIRGLKKELRKILNADVALISGGVSMGDYDLIPEVLASLGVKRIFHGVNIKPGKPLFFGKKNKTLVFGIPGNPVSNFLAYLVFVRPALRKMMGYKDFKPVFKEGIAEKEFRSKSRRRHFVLAKITKRGDSLYLRPVISHGSADTAALSKADGFLMITEGSKIVKKNSKARFITWKKL